MVQAEQFKCSNYPEAHADRVINLGTRFMMAEEGHSQVFQICKNLKELETDFWAMMEEE